MKLKYMFISLVILMASIFLIACDEMEGLPSVEELEDSIREIITTKGENYDFLNDKQYMSKMNEFVDYLVDHHLIKEEHFKLGNLNDDNIPELVVFRERDPKDIHDQGALEVYGFVEGKYSLLSRVPMNYDNTNYELVIGKIGPKQNGILLNNQAGSQSGITYGFILEDGKLVKALNENKINLISINTENEIMDINKDGILEFSILTIDPENRDPSTKDANKIKYWYQWDGFDGATLVKYERIKSDHPKESRKSNPDVLAQAKTMLASDRRSFIGYLETNKDSLSIIDTTQLLSEYFNTMFVEAKAKEVVINGLFSKYQLGNSSDDLFNKYGLSLERLNDSTYLSRERILSSEIELKEHLINNLNLGYKLNTKDGKYVYSINYQIFLDKFGENILKEYRDYYRILAQYLDYPHVENETLVIEVEKLAERIILMDNFKKTYPYSNFIDDLSPIYDDYLNTLLFGSTNNPVLDKGSALINEKILLQYENIIEKYPQSNLSDILSSYHSDLKEKFSN